jgi:hypothetical protein
VSGVEWNLVGETSGSGALDRELIAAFDDLWQQATPLSADVVERYAERVRQVAWASRLGSVQSEPSRHAGNRRRHSSPNIRPLGLVGLRSTTTITRSDRSRYPLRVPILSCHGPTFVTAAEAVVPIESR